MKDGCTFDNEDGMTLRDYFAAKAMTSHQLISHVGGIADNKALADAAYAMADAMIAARGAA